MKKKFPKLTFAFLTIGFFFMSSAQKKTIPTYDTKKTFEKYGGVFYGLATIIGDKNAFQLYLSSKSEYVELVDVKNTGFNYLLPVFKNHSIQVGLNFLSLNFRYDRAGIDLPALKYKKTGYSYDFSASFVEFPFYLRSSNDSPFFYTIGVHYAFLVSSTFGGNEDESYLVTSDGNGYGIDSSFGGYLGFGYQYRFTSSLTLYITPYLKFYSYSFLSHHHFSETSFRLGVLYDMNKLFGK